MRSVKLAIGLSTASPKSAVGEPLLLWHCTVRALDDLAAVLPGACACPPAHPLRQPVECLSCLYGIFPPSKAVCQKENRQPGEECQMKARVTPRRILLNDSQLCELRSKQISMIAYGASHLSDLLHSVKIADRTEAFFRRLLHDILWFPASAHRQQTSVGNSMLRCKPVL